MDEQILENWSVDRATMNVDNILGWAAEWNTQLAPNIPKFIKEDVIERADIRVSFGSKGVRYNYTRSSKSTYSGRMAQNQFHTLPSCRDNFFLVHRTCLDVYLAWTYI